MAATPIVHNSRSGNNYDYGINPTGFSANVEIATTVGEGGTTPEPATLAIMGLGFLGAGFAARRRNKK